LWGKIAQGTGRKGKPLEEAAGRKLLKAQCPESVNLIWRPEVVILSLLKRQRREILIAENVSLFSHKVQLTGIFFGARPS